MQLSIGTCTLKVPQYKQNKTSKSFQLLDESTLEKVSVFGGKNENKRNYCG
jgi:hypothetical protein